MRVFKILLKIFIFPLAAPLLLPGCARTPEVRESEFMMGTVVEVTVRHRDRNSAEKAAEKSFREGRRLEKLLSLFIDGSDVSRINENAGIEALSVSPETFFVIEQSVSFSEMSGGAFDITILPVLDLWGFKNGERNVPGERELARALELVDYRQVILDPEEMTVKLAKEGMRIDLGGIAKGFVVDRMAEVLDEAGAEAALVNAGGDIYALGPGAGEEGWRIGIRHPAEEGRMLDVVSIRDGAVGIFGAEALGEAHETTPT